MRSLKHINAYLFLHGKPVSKGAVDKFLSILQDDIKSGKITKAKDKYTKEVDRIQRSLVGMSNVMFPDEVAKVEIEAPRKKHYEKCLSGQGLGSLPIIIAGAISSLTTHHIQKIFGNKKGLSGVSKGKLLASSPTEEGILAIINKYFYSTTFKLVDGVLHNSKGPVNHFTVDQKKGRYRFLETGSLSGSEGVDLFEDHENIPAKLQKVLDKHSKAFEDGNYDLLAKALKAVEKIGYTFEYYLDGGAYDLRKIGEKGKSESMDGVDELSIGDHVSHKNKDYKIIKVNKYGSVRIEPSVNPKPYDTITVDKNEVEITRTAKSIRIAQLKNSIKDKTENLNLAKSKSSKEFFKIAIEKDEAELKSLSGIKADEKKLRKSVKAKGIRLTHGYKLAKRKKGVTKKVTRKVTPKKVAPKKAKKVAVKKTVAKKLPTVKVIPAKKHSPGKAIAPKNNKVKASVTAAIADLLTLDKYKNYGAMFLGMFYSTFKNSDVVGDKIGDMKEKMFEKYEFDLFEHDYHANTIEITEKGKELIKSIEGRINTLKAKKSGTDLFPELGSTKGPKTISETVDQVLGAMKAERSGVKTVNAKKHNTHILPVYRQVEVMTVQNTPSPVTSSHVQTSTVKTEGTMSGAEMGQMTFEKLNFNDYYKGIFGSPATNFDMCIDGSPGSGKTTFLLMFGNYLADFHGPTLFVTTEEFGSATLIDKINRFNIKSKNIRFAKKMPPDDELKKYSFVFIDSINHAKITIEQYQQMREKAPKTAFILVLQQTKGGTYKGSTDWPHEVEITMSLFKNEFDERMLKISKDRYTDPVPRVVKI